MVWLLGEFTAEKLYGSNREGDEVKRDIRERRFSIIEGKQGVCQEGWHSFIIPGSSWKAGGLRIPGQTRLHSQTLSQNNRSKTKKEAVLSP